MSDTFAIELKGVTKVFGQIVANKDVNLQVKKGEILAILGENGSGKTTLMNMLSGIYFPDEGQIFVNGEEVVIKSPKDAFKYGIGMVHQHFKLVDVFTATENIVLGIKDKEKYSLKKAEQRVKEITDKYGFDINLDSKVYEMSVSEKQTVEIVKVLYRGAQTLILDEPTAVLTPQETEKLFDVLRRMKKDGKSIIIITHKLHEVMSLTDRVAVLRKGQHIATVNTSETSEQELTEMMVGEKVDLNIGRTNPHDVEDRIVVNHLSSVNHEGVKVLDDVSFTAKSGEILGIAGIAGSGQKELCETIAGLQKIEKGAVLYNKENIIGKTPKEIINLGISMSFIPEDRLGMGLIASVGMTDNMLLKTYKQGKLCFVDRKPAKALSKELIEKLEIKTPSTELPVRTLSGGNVQKVLLGREIHSEPDLLITAYPVRGLDINSSYLIYSLLNEQKKKNTAVLFIGEDLDVLLELCDRIMVLCHGKITGICDAKKVTKEQVGMMMTGSTMEEVLGIG